MKTVQVITQQNTSCIKGFTYMLVLGSCECRLRAFLRASVHSEFVFCNQVHDISVSNDLNKKTNS